MDIVTFVKIMDTTVNVLSTVGASVGIGCLVSFAGRAIRTRH